VASPRPRRRRRFRRRLQVVFRLALARDAAPRPSPRARGFSLRVEGPYEATTSGWRSGVRQRRRRKASREARRDRKQRGTLGGETAAPGSKVLEDRRAPRERGRTGTGVMLERA
jgi:hypothetical protein